MSPTKRRSESCEPAFSLDDLLTAFEAAPPAEPGWFTKREAEIAWNLGPNATAERLVRLRRADKLEAKRGMRPNIVGVLTHTVLYKIK
jgi:hypothetical protein